MAKGVIHNHAKERNPQSLTTVGTGKARVRMTVITRGLGKHGQGLEVSRGAQEAVKG